MQNFTAKQEKTLKPQKRNLRLHRLFRDCLLGYGWFLTLLGKVLLFLLALLLSVSLIVIPLWYLSTSYPTFYGYFVAGLLGVSILIPFFLRLFKAFKNSSKQELQQRIGTKMRRTAFLLMELFLLLGAFRFYQEGNLAVAIGFSTVFLFGLGVGFHRYHEKVQ